MTSPTLKLQPKAGPALHTSAQQLGPALDLNASGSRPALTLHRVHTSQLPTLSVIPYVLAAVLAAALCLIPLLYLASWRGGEGAGAPPWYLTLLEKANLLLNNSEEQEEGMQAQAPEPVIETPAAELPQDVPSQIVALENKSCQNFLDDGDDPAAKHAFDQLIWSRLSKEWQDSAAGRLEVCTPFKWQTPNVLSAMACAKGACGTDDVKFYVTRDGKVGIDVTDKGTCTQAVEDGFSSPELLCTR